MNMTLLKQRLANPDERLVAYAGMALLFASMIPWLVIVIQMRIPDDAAWLSAAAGLFLAGEKMTEAYFDTNPPMSYLIFIPVQLLVKAGLPLWYGVTIYGLALAVLSLSLTAIFVRAWPGVSLMAKMAVFTAFLISITLFVRIEFGQKDHLIAIMLFPFLLAQLALACRHDVSKKVIIATLLAGTPFILLKPHYGLLPTLMIGHRLYKERKLSALWQPDVIILAAGTLLYGAAIALWFPDFVRIALPLILELYTDVVEKQVFQSAASLLFLNGCIMAGVWYVCQTPEARYIGKFLCFMSLAAVIPFAVQLKGFSLHMFPATTLAWVALAFVLAVFSEEKMKDWRYAPILFSMGFVILAYSIALPKPDYPTHKTVLNTELVKYLKNNNVKNGFLVQTNSTNGIAAASLYTGIPFASRFSCFWFLPLPENPERQEELKEIFGKYIAEDIEKYKPEIIALYSDPLPTASVPDMFEGQEDFDRAWKSYKLKETIIIDYGEFFAFMPSASGNVAAMMYDIYVRTP